MKALAALGFGASLLLGTGLAQASHTCVSTLDNMMALASNYDQARATFADKTMANPAGGTMLCGSDEINCWDYREVCGSNWVDFWPGSYSHFHLGFDNAAYNSAPCFCDPHDGKGAGYALSSQCTACPSWVTLGRSMTSHQGSQWAQIHVRTDYACTQDFSADCNVPFTFNILSVGGTQAVDVWILDANWHWNIWTGLSAGVNWNWGAFPAREVWFKAANNSAAPYTINGYTVTVAS
jgi:hypothetical protein